MSTECTKLEAAHSQAALFGVILYVTHNEVTMYLQWDA